MNASLLSLALTAAAGAPLSVSFLGGGGGGAAGDGACDTKVLVNDCGSVSIACCAQQSTCNPAAEELSELSKLSELACAVELSDLEGLEGLEVELEGLGLELEGLGCLDESDELEELQEALEAELEQALEQFEREMEALEEQMEEAREAEEEALEEALEAAEEGDFGISAWRPGSVQELARLAELYAPAAKAAAPLAAALHQQAGSEGEVEAHVQALEALLAGQARAAEEVRVAAAQAGHAAALEARRTQETAVHGAHKALVEALGSTARVTVHGAQSGSGKPHVLWVSKDGETHTLELEGGGPHAIYVDEDGARAVKIDGHQVWTSENGQDVKAKAKDPKDKARKKARTLLAPQAPDAPELPLVLTTEDGKTIVVQPGQIPAPIAPLLRGQAGGDELQELKDLLEQMHGELRELRSSVQELRDELRELQTR